MRRWRIAGWLRQGAGWAYVALPAVLLCAMTCLTIFIAEDYFRPAPYDNIWRSHWAGCGDFRKVDIGREGGQDYLALEITDKDTGQFLIAGNLHLSATSSRQMVTEKQAAMVELRALPSPNASMFGFISPMLEIDMDQVQRHWDGSSTVPVKPTRLHTGGVLADFPFDHHRTGYIPALLVSKPDETVWRDFPLDAAITNVRLSKAMAVRKALHWDEYVEGVALSPETGNRGYETQECALLLQRAPWYQAMVVLLVMLLFVPTVYLLFRPEDHPGVDLIAVILGVAAIRQFLLGNLTDWTLYKLDMVFVLITVVTAAVPLWHIHRRARAARAARC